MEHKKLSESVHDVDLSVAADYDAVKDRIMCRLINGEFNRQFLQDKPHTEMEDMAVVYQIATGRNGEDDKSITVSDSLMDRYGITTDELHEQAVRNMDVLQPFSFKSMTDVLADMFISDMEAQGMDTESAREEALQVLPDASEVVSMYVLTNDVNYNGAAEILNDNVRQKIADKIGDFYVLPSSVHETLIIPKSENLDTKELEQMVRDVNKTQVLPEERLSSHVYEYDARTHELFRSDRAEERKMQKEKAQEIKKERPSLKNKLSEKKNTVMTNNTRQQDHMADKKREAVI